MHWQLACSLRSFKDFQLRNVCQGNSLNISFFRLIEMSFFYDFSLEIFLIEILDHTAGIRVIV